MKNLSTHTLTAFSELLFQSCSTRDTHIVYHKDCPDGSGAAALFLLTFIDLGYQVEAQDARKGFLSLIKENSGSPLRVQFHAREYSEQRALPDFTNTTVVVVDFSLKKETNTCNFHEACKLADSVFWIDHHEGAWHQFEQDCQDYEGVPDNFYMYFDSKRAGVALAFQVCYPGKSEPKLVSYLEDRDINKWEIADSAEFLLGFDNAYRTNDILAYAEAMSLSLASKGLRSRDQLSLEAAHTLEEEFHSECVQYGTTSLKVRASLVAQACERALPVWIDGKMGYIVGMQRVLAHDAAMLLAAREDAHFGATFEIESSTRVKVSFRGHKNHGINDQRVLEYAKKLGGGGHPFAAACYLDLVAFSQLLATSQPTR
jgi:nanoRNase/pAp phosphatase (c-di-AMP/oligoRNAs hydrolase)